MFPLPCFSLRQYVSSCFVGASRRGPVRSLDDHGSTYYRTAARRNACVRFRMPEEGKKRSPLGHPTSVSPPATVVWAVASVGRAHPNPVFDLPSPVFVCRDG